MGRPKVDWVLHSKGESNAYILIYIKSHFYKKFMYIHIKLTYKLSLRLLIKQKATSEEWFGRDGIRIIILNLKLISTIN